MKLLLCLMFILLSLIIKSQTNICGPTIFVDRGHLVIKDTVINGILRSDKILRKDAFLMMQQLGNNIVGAIIVFADSSSTLTTFRWLNGLSFGKDMLIPCQSVQGCLSFQILNEAITLGCPNVNIASHTTNVIFVSIAKGKVSSEFFSDYVSLIYCNNSLTAAYHLLDNFSSSRLKCSRRHLSREFKNSGGSKSIIFPR